MTFFLDLRADSVGGILANEVTPRQGWNAINPDVLDQAAHGHNVLLVAHGFNVDRANGINSLSWWEDRLQLDPSTLFVGVLWPGDSAWVPGIDYPLEGNEAIASGQLLCRYLNQRLTGATGMSFASHSLGARVVLEAIGKLQRPVQSLTLMAGAIDDDCLVAEYQYSASKPRRISVLASTGDTVLEWAFPTGNLFSGIITRGHPYWHGALGRDGPDTPYPGNLQPLWQIPDGWKYRHADYFGDAAPIGPLMARPVNVPPQGSPEPQTPIDWRPAWSAAFAATRL